jgi:NifU-like protein involved in Fe-S cluster formation/bacterioferritin-associated ferredoxin
MLPYPKHVGQVLHNLRHTGHIPDVSAHGRSAAFECGSGVQFSIRIDSETKTLKQVCFITNGCGYMAAAAEIIARATKGRKLTTLHGSSDLESDVFESLGHIPIERRHCILVSVAAFRSALAEYRGKLIEEFQGEKALICTCFGVDEETISKAIAQTDAKDPSQVSDVCNAGSGCGSCRMLIQEMIDAKLNIFADEFML